MVRQLLVAGVMSLALAGAAHADHCCHYEWVTVPKCVIEYECRKVPYTKTVCLYDDCGRPYHVTKTFYRTVEVPVKRVVYVRQRVKVCD